MLKITNTLKNITEAADELNGFVTVSDELGEVKPGPLAGITLGVKDNIHVAGLSNMAASKGLQHFIPDQSSPVVQKLVDAGAIILGKTNMHELAFGVTGINGFCGPARNPYNPDYFAGGSSSGSASMVAAGLVRCSLGTDTGGSMRIPAAHCGVIGFRPTTGRYSNEGVTPVSHTRDTIGTMGRSMSDIVRMDQVITDSQSTIRPANLGAIRMGVPADPFYRNLDPETARIIEAALERLEASGATLVREDIPGLADLTQKASFPIALYETLPNLRSYLKRYAPDISLEKLVNGIESEDVREMLTGLMGDHAVSEDDYRAAIEDHRPQMQRMFAEYLATHALDAIVFPTTILPASRIDGICETVPHNGVESPTFPTYVQNTDLGSVMGVPGLTIPAGLASHNRPVGLALDAAAGQDVALLSIGLAVEEALGAIPPPPLFHSSEQIN